MNDFDPLVPTQLKSLQQWFGKLISRRLAEKDCIAPLTPEGNSIVDEAAHYIIPSSALKPHERLQIYNQQYWWRLLTLMQESFPLVTALFGYENFNEDLATPYLLHFPPTHWSLNTLGQSFPSWIKSFYKEKDAGLVYDASELDLAYFNQFLTPCLPTLELTEGMEKILHVPIYLQPSVQLFQHPYNLFAWRREFLKQNPDYWMNHEFPPLKKGIIQTILLRLPQGNSGWRHIVETEYLLLKKINNGISIDALCDWLEKQPRRIREPAETSLQAWFKEWTVSGILTLEKHAGA